MFSTYPSSCLVLSVTQHSPHLKVYFCSTILCLLSMYLPNPFAMGKMWYKVNFFKRSKVFHLLDCLTVSSILTFFSSFAILSLPFSLSQLILMPMVSEINVSMLNYFIFALSSYVETHAYKSTNAQIQNLSLFLFASLSLYHHHVAPSARISLSFSCHPCLLFIAYGRSPGLDSVSSQSCCL